MLNHINKYAPCAEIGEFLIISRTVWSDLDENNQQHHPDGYPQQVEDTACNIRYAEALLEGWVEAGIVHGENERLIVLVKPTPHIDEIETDIEAARKAAELGRTYAHVKAGA